ncbi:ABC transporter permease [Pseudogulbenkiania subflava]|uniref:Osmoprotectant transport system permease protein n=1 Tax=Pseudogulbenkiania subflava DSM 22618 TaxID=1123014 RepID=A0A1Y6BTT8_9NEIS|nr:ABC transporter permease [Pseudogulbenkiania subflava]SMF20119.1 osmoprotectant transport system permease protein [Pseudogulbenkiania subflava DSM 22618]
MTVRNPVPLLLVGLMLLAAWTLPLLSHAPNRLLSGRGIQLATLLHGPRLLLLLPAVPLLAAPWLPPRRGCCVLLASAASLWLAALTGLAGAEAARLAGGADTLARTSLGGGYWALFILGALLANDALRRLGGAGGRLALAQLALYLPLLWLLLSGRLEALSLLKEYANHRDSFDEALGRHLQLVGLTLLPAGVGGAALGLWAFCRPRARGVLFAALNIVQTVPSLALFGLLIAPLAALGRLLPGSGLAGIGLPPALLALTLYGLLPMARSTLAGLQQIPDGVLEAARGMGLSAGQRWRRVELPLALPVLISGLRVTAIQAVGLAQLAALIGAGGFGAIMFQGLSGSALDLVLLGVIPVVALAVAVDALFKLLLSLLEVGPR